MHDETKVNLVTILAATLVVIYLIVAGHGCTERRDNLVAECLASERAVQECALVKCQYGSSGSALCALAFVEEN